VVPPFISKSPTIIQYYLLAYKIIKLPCLPWEETYKLSGFPKTISPLHGSDGIPSGAITRNLEAPPLMVMKYEELIGIVKKDVPSKQYCRVTAKRETAYNGRTIMKSLSDMLP